LPIDPLYQKAMLDWVTGGAAATRPGGRWVSLATASPTSQSAFDGPFTPRQTATFAAANSPQGSATNLNIMSFTLTAASATAIAWNLWESSVGGARLAYGTLSAGAGVRTAGSTVAFTAGNLIIILS